jgi:hypothetical protein
VDSIDADPASITNFNGVAGLAYLSGTVRRTNTVTNEVPDLPFIDADMRFMQDFADFNTALSGAPGVPAIVSFEVRWQGVEQRVGIEDPDTDFSAEFVRGRAQMEWSAVVGDYMFGSDRHLVQ